MERRSRSRACPAACSPARVSCRVDRAPRASMRVSMRPRSTLRRSRVALSGATPIMHGAAPPRRELRAAPTRVRPARRPSGASSRATALKEEPAATSTRPSHARPKTECSRTASRRAIPRPTRSSVTCAWAARAAPAPRRKSRRSRFADDRLAANESFAEVNDSFVDRWASRPRRGEFPAKSRKDDMSDDVCTHDANAGMAAA